MASSTWNFGFSRTLEEIEGEMVYFDSWDEFAAAVEQLCVAEPRKVGQSGSQFTLEKCT